MLRGVTIITDASANGNCTAWGWAGKVICDNGRRMYSGRGRAQIYSSNDAELYAIANTLHAMMTDPQPIADRGSPWWIQCDNEHVVRLIAHRYNAQNRQHPVRASEQQLLGLEYIERLRLLAEPAYVRIRHIKGHVHPGDRQARHEVHTEVDALSRKARTNG